MEAQGRAATGTPQPATSPGAEVAAAAPQSWVDVPDNILIRISTFLHCRADRVHMACATRGWNTALRGRRRPPPPVLPPLSPLPLQLPWLIFPSTEAPTFYSAITRRYHRLRGIPDDVRRARSCGSGDAGWLVLALDARHTYALYNLNSGWRIPLPPNFTTPGGRDFPLVVRVATLSAPPGSPDPYMVAAIVLVGKRSTAAFWSEGSDHWFTTGPPSPLTSRPQDVIYHGDAFFFITSREDVISFRPWHGWDDNVYLTRVDYDMEPREDYDVDVGFVDGTGAMRRYLVESRGRLLMVVRYVYDYDEGGTEVIRVFEFRVVAPAANVLQRPRAAWDHLGDELDGRMLFLGPGCSRSFEIAQYNGGFGFEESTIYFLDDDLSSVPSSADGGRRLYSFTDTGRYSMEDMTTEPWPPGHPSRSDNGPLTWWLP